MGESLLQTITTELSDPWMREEGRRGHERRVYRRAGANLDRNGPTAIEGATDEGLVL